MIAVLCLRRLLRLYDMTREQSKRLEARTGVYGPFRHLARSQNRETPGPGWVAGFKQMYINYAREVLTSDVSNGMRVR